jgi:hypothetical protein
MKEALPVLGVLLLCIALALGIAAAIFFARKSGSRPRIGGGGAHGAGHGGHGGGGWATMGKYAIGVLVVLAGLWVIGRLADTKPADRESRPATASVAGSGSGARLFPAPLSLTINVKPPEGDTRKVPAATANDYRIVKVPAGWTLRWGFQNGPESGVAECHPTFGEDDDWVPPVQEECPGDTNRVRFKSAGEEQYLSWDFKPQEHTKTDET